MKIVMATGTFDLIHPGHALFLEEAKKLGGEDAKLVVVLARDSTVRSKKRIPIINEKQRLEMVKFLKPVNEAVLGSETDMFEVVEKIKPDIIAIGPDQKFDLNDLRKDLKNRGFNCQVKRITKYHKSNLDSSCKIIKKIKNSEFDENAFKNC
ncbi:MAG: adenylyltransferase/cytidyltransferase family protein [Methanobacteriaceae archaeon]|nr:adenylyltransferase/cytidyltransferase family protein [Methanobacteriaceae archaeon]MDP2837206.1 adenylyltransferase/cytidyltransferase family protein [Methanobacteriaceae archaeon]MDP3034964.1 adenylyltransferase/cytidyltransferase family protein [Methanobacteriaceae archaeon]MDP3485109.1 adenylyltransferase/cytidyltransferase family protein [Methanobacteriaceae archaeon]MDP3623903.1 adenylyltransferase/cytidyltransferase family protein [Methanobacteriaceae archaeon]